jgi:O-antigen/teichoic acid export membrane protein
MPLAQPAFEKSTRDSAACEADFVIPTRDQVRTWGAKSFGSLADQGLSSAAGFIANVLLARWMPAAEYGAFVVAFAGYLFLTLFHNALLLEPLSVIGPARHATRLGEYFQAQLRVHGVLVWPLTGIILLTAWILSRIAPNNPLIDALIGGGLSLPLLLLLWLTRRMCYVLRRPGIAVLGSGLYCVFSLAALVALRAVHHLTPLGAFVALGLGSMVGSTIILRKVIAPKVSAKSPFAVRWRTTLNENWTYGRWLIGGALLYAISTSIQTFFAAGELGLDAAGILRAMQVPSLAMTQGVTAFGLLILPSFAYDFGNQRHKRLRRHAILVASGLGIAALAFTGCLAVGATRIEWFLYHGKYVAYARLIPLLALIPVTNGFGAGWSMALRASQKPHCDLIANAIAAPIAVLSTIFLVTRFGLMGAAISMVLSFALTNLVMLMFFAWPERASRRRNVPAEEKAQVFVAALSEEDV